MRIASNVVGALASYLGLGGEVLRTVERGRVYPVLVGRVDAALLGLQVPGVPSRPPAQPRPRLLQLPGELMNLIITELATTSEASLMALASTCKQLRPVCLTNRNTDAMRRRVGAQYASLDRVIAHTRRALRY